MLEVKLSEYRQTTISIPIEEFEWVEHNAMFLPGASFAGFVRYLLAREVQRMQSEGPILVNCDKEESAT